MAILPNTVIIDVRCVPDLKEASELAEIVGGDLTTAEFIESRRMGEFLPIELQKIASISIMNIGLGNKNSFFNWVACSGNDERAIVQKALAVLHDSFLKSDKGEYPVIVTHDGGRHALRLLTKKGTEMYMESRQAGEKYPDFCKAALMALKDDSDKWGNRKPNYLNPRAGRWSVDLQQSWGGGIGQYMATAVEEMYFKASLALEKDPVKKGLIIDLLNIKERRKMLDRKRLGLAKNCDLTFSDQDEKTIITNVENGIGSTSFKDLCELNAKILVKDFKSYLIDNEFCDINAKMPDVLLNMGTDQAGKNGRSLKISVHNKKEDIPDIGKKDDKSSPEDFGSMGDR